MYFVYGRRRQVCQRSGVKLSRISRQNKGIPYANNSELERKRRGFGINVQGLQLTRKCKINAGTRKIAMTWGLGKVVPAIQAAEFLSEDRGGCT